MPRLKGKAWRTFVEERGGRAPIATPKPSRPRPRGPRRAYVPSEDPNSTPIPAIQVAEVLVVPAPRQSRRDAWNPRPCVLRYRACADHLRVLRLRLPPRFALVFYLPMPASWSRTKRDAVRGQPMQQLGDGDNLQKTVMDALVRQDGRLWDGRWVKLWADGPRLVIADPTQVVVDDAFLAFHQPGAT